MPQKDLSPINETPESKVTLTCTVLAAATREIYWYKGKFSVSALVITNTQLIIESLK